MIVKFTPIPPDLVSPDVVAWVHDGLIYVVSKCRVEGLTRLEVEATLEKSSAYIQHDVDPRVNAAFDLLASEIIAAVYDFSYGSPH